MPEPTLVGAISAIVPLQAGLAVNFDAVQFDGSKVKITSKIARVYKVPPAADSDLEPPCWMNSWTFGADLRAPQGLAVTDYSFLLDLYVEEASGGELDLLADLVAHYHDVWIAALRTNLRLVDVLGQINATNEAKIRGADPTLCILRWNGKDYVGARYRMTFDQWSNVAFG